MKYSTQRTNAYSRLWAEKKMRYLIIGTGIVWAILILATIGGATAYNFSIDTKDGRNVTANITVTYNDGIVTQRFPNATGPLNAETGGFISYQNSTTGTYRANLTKTYVKPENVSTFRAFVAISNNSNYNVASLSSLNYTATIPASCTEGANITFGVRYNVGTVSIDTLCFNHTSNSYSVFETTTRQLGYAFNNTYCTNRTNYNISYYNDGNLSRITGFEIDTLTGNAVWCDYNKSSSTLSTGAGKGIAEMWLQYSPFGIVDTFQAYADSFVYTGDYFNSTPYNGTDVTANITVNALGYAEYTSNLLMENGSYLFNLTPTSYNFTFIDEDTGALISNVTMLISGSDVGYNYTTTNGTVVSYGLSQGSYLVTLNSAGYYQRQYSLVFDSDATTTLYLIGTGNATAIRFTVLNQAYQPLTNATVNALKKNLSGTNYYNVADCITDNNGECTMYLQTLTTTYRFLTEYYTVSRVSSDTTLSRDTYTIVLNTAESSLQNTIARSNIQSSLSYDNAGGFTYTVNDPSDQVTGGTLYVYRRYGNRETLISSSTGSGTTFIVTVSGVNVTLGDEVIARGYVDIGGSPVLTHTTTVTDNKLGGSLAAGALLLTVCVVFTVIFIFSWNPIAPLLMFGVVFLFFNAVGLINFGLPAVISIIVVIMVALYRMRSV